VGVEHLFRLRGRDQNCELTGFNSHTLFNISIDRDGVVGVAILSRTFIDLINLSRHLDFLSAATRGDTCVTGPDASLALQPPTAFDAISNIDSVLVGKSVCGDEQLPFRLLMRRKDENQLVSLL